jgi:hypothetical protein
MKLLEISKKPDAIPEGLKPKYDEMVLKFTQFNAQINAAGAAQTDMSRAQQENDARLRMESQGL